MRPACSIVVITRSDEVFIYESYTNTDVVRTEPGWLHINNGAGTIVTLPADIVKTATVKFGY